MLVAQKLNDVFGTVSPPPGVDKFNIAAGAGAQNIGLLLFVSNMIRLVTVVAGVWVLFNFITAGVDYITSGGDSKVTSSVKDKLTMSVLGLVIIVGAHTIIAVLSFVLFGDVTFILSPKITGPTP